jgi:hypothetical protein
MFSKSFVILSGAKNPAEVATGCSGAGSTGFFAALGMTGVGWVEFYFFSRTSRPAQL